MEANSTLATFPFPPRKRGQTKKTKTFSLAQLAVRSPISRAWLCPTPEVAANLRMDERECRLPESPDPTHNQ